MLEFVIFALYRQILGATAVGYNCVDCEWREKVSTFLFFVFEIMRNFVIIITINHTAMKTKFSILNLMLIIFSMNLSAQEQPQYIKNLESAGFKVFDIGEGYYKYQNLTSNFVVLKGDGTIIGEFTAVGEFRDGRLCIARGSQVVSSTGHVTQYASDRGWTISYDDYAHKLILSNYDIVDRDFNSILKFPINSFVIFRDGFGSFEDAHAGKYMGRDKFAAYLWGIMDINGNLICPPTFEFITEIPLGGYFVIGDKYQGEFGVCDTSGNIVIPISKTFKNYRRLINNETKEETFILTIAASGRYEKGAYKVSELVKYYAQTQNLKKAISLCTPIK